MNVLLQAMERDGLVSRPDQPSAGRVLPTRLTPLGQRRLDAASAAAKAVEDQMRVHLDSTEQDRLRLLLAACVTSLNQR